MWPVYCVWLYYVRAGSTKMYAANDAEHIETKHARTINVSLIKSNKVHEIFQDLDYYFAEPTSIRRRRCCVNSVHNWLYLFSAVSLPLSLTLQCLCLANCATGGVAPYLLRGSRYRCDAIAYHTIEPRRYECMCRRHDVISWHSGNVKLMLQEPCEWIWLLLMWIIILVLF